MQNAVGVDAGHPEGFGRGLGCACGQGKRDKGFAEHQDVQLRIVGRLKPSGD
jgi:hypothetical protein